MMSPENLLRDKIIMLLVLKDFINMCPWSQLNKVFGQIFFILLLVFDRGESMYTILFMQNHKKNSIAYLDRSLILPDQEHWCQVFQRPPQLQ